MNFSFSFEGLIWNAVIVPLQKILILEVRDEKKRQVSFSALQYESKSFFWQNHRLTERWWIGLLAARDSVVLFHKYNEAGNPDRLTVLAMDFYSRKILWKKENFSFHDFTPGGIIGFSGSEQSHQEVLDPLSGEQVDYPEKLDFGNDKISDPLRPFQYLEGTPFFETVRSFLKKVGIAPVVAAEYLDYQELIIISYYVKEENGLINFLLVLDKNGGTLLNEKIAEGLKGIGADTFFILPGYLFYVRNRNEFFSYKIV